MGNRKCRIQDYGFETGRVGFRIKVGKQEGHEPGVCLGNRKGRIQNFGFETGRMDSELEDLNSKFIQYTYMLNGRDGGGF